MRIKLTCKKDMNITDIVNIKLQKKRAKIAKVLNKIWGLPAGFPGGSEVKASACNVGDLGSIPGLGRSTGEGYGHPLQDSGLENPIDGGAWWATVHGVAKSRTRLSDLTFTFTFK